MGLYLKQVIKKTKSVFILYTFGQKQLSMSEYTFLHWNLLVYGLNHF